MLEKLEINNSCVPCNACYNICPENSVFTDGEKYVIDNWSCTQCGLCIEVCPVDAIKIKPNLSSQHNQDQ